MSSIKLVLRVDVDLPRSEALERMEEWRQKTEFKLTDIVNPKNWDKFYPKKIVPEDNRYKVVVPTDYQSTPAYLYFDEGPGNKTTLRLEHNVTGGREIIRYSLIALGLVLIATAIASINLERGLMLLFLIVEFLFGGLIILSVWLYFFFGYRWHRKVMNTKLKKLVEVLSRDQLTPK